MNAKAYDKDGREVIIPQEHNIVMGKNKCVFVPIKGFEVKFIYRPPGEKTI